MIEALRDLLRIPTVSTRDASTADDAAFDAFHEALRRHFPLLHETLARACLHPGPDGADRATRAGHHPPRGLLTRPLLAAGPEAAAMARTTFAVTTLSGSPALNVVAATATAGVNIRILVGDTAAAAIAHVRKAIRDPKVRIRVIDEGEPSPSSPLDEAFDLVEATTAAHFPQAVTSPYVMMAATDARFFTSICERVYRFTPFEMTRKQRESIHARDEHITVDAYLNGIAWYRTFIESLQAPPR